MAADRGLGFPDCQSLICRAATYLRFDGVQVTDALQRLGGNINRGADVNVVDFSTGVRHTSRFDIMSSRRPPKMNRWPSNGSVLSVFWTFDVRPLKPFFISVMPETSQMSEPVGGYHRLPPFISRMSTCSISGDSWLFIQQILDNTSIVFLKTLICRSIECHIIHQIFPPHEEGWHES